MGTAEISGHEHPHAPGALRGFIDANYRASRWLDRTARWITGRRDGNYHFLEEIVPGLLVRGARVLDVGGGKRPAVPIETKRALGLEYVGLDIDARELARAPEGAYERTIAGDVASAKIDGAFDLIVSSATLEHVREVRRALENLAGALAPGGTMAHFMPCAFAPFALVNRALGNESARRVLYAVYPKVRASQGFEAFYRECWPSRMRAMLGELGLVRIEAIPYYSSGYASFFFPAHGMEVAYQLAAKASGLEDLCEAFTVIARKPS